MSDVVGAISLDGAADGGANSFGAMFHDPCANGGANASDDAGSLGANAFDGAADGGASSLGANAFHDLCANADVLGANASMVHVRQYSLPMRG